MSEAPVLKAGWISVYVLKRAHRYRVSIVDAPTTDGWLIDDEQSVCIPASTDLAKLREEVDRRCQPPLSHAQAVALVAALRGHVLDRPVAGKYSAIELTDDKYATIWRRFFARWVDSLIFAPVGLAYYFGLSHWVPIPIRVLIFVVSCASFPVYSIWMHGRYGQTLGKMACKVKVLDKSERPLSLWQAVLRDIYNVALLPVYLAIDIPRIIQGVDIFTVENQTTIDSVLLYAGFVWFAIEVVVMLSNNKRRALHDFICGSVVVRWP